MKKALIISGLAGIGLMLPTGAMAGSLNNSFGASSSEFTGTSTGTSSITVLSNIEIDNEVNIDSVTSTTSLDLDANNGRLITREDGAAFYDQESGMASGAIDFEGAGEFEFVDSTTTSENFEAQGTADVEVVSETSGVVTGFAGCGGPCGRFLNPAGIQALAQSGDIETSGSVSGEADVSVEDSTTSTTTDSNFGAVIGDAQAGGSFSTNGTGWAGIQSETAVDGQLSGSFQSGTTTVSGIIRESGLTTTTVNLESITTGTSFGSSASSFRNASF
jgi:hypothetical protein